MKIRADHSGLERRVAAERRALEVAARGAVIAAGDAVVDRLEKDAPRDTQRYVRGWVEAAISAGGKSRLVPEVVRGRFATAQLAILERQVKSIEKQIKWRSERFERWSKDSTGAGRKLTPWMQRERRRIYSLLNLLERAKEQFRMADGDGESFILIGKGYGRRLATVRTKVYGGSGRVVFKGGEARIELKNKEPHVRIVESRMAPLARAIQRAGPDVVMRREFAKRMGRNAQATALRA